jgi:hypothetical protein
MNWTGRKMWKIGTDKSFVVARKNRFFFAVHLPEHAPHSTVENKFSTLVFLVAENCPLFSFQLSTNSNSANCPN